MSYREELESNPELMAEARDIGRMMFAHSKLKEFQGFRELALQTAYADESLRQARLNELDARIQKCHAEIERLYAVRPFLHTCDFSIQTEPIKMPAVVYAQKKAAMGHGLSALCKINQNLKAVVKNLSSTSKIERSKVRDDISVELNLLSEVLKEFQSVEQLAGEGDSDQELIHQLIEQMSAINIAFKPNGFRSAVDLLPKLKKLESERIALEIHS